MTEEIYDKLAQAVIDGEVEDGPGRGHEAAPGLSLALVGVPARQPRPGQRRGAIAPMGLCRPAVTVGECHRPSVPSVSTR